MVGRGEQRARYDHQQHGHAKDADREDRFNRPIDRRGFTPRHDPAAEDQGRTQRDRDGEGEPAHAGWLLRGGPAPAASDNPHPGHDEGHCCPLGGSGIDSEEEHTDDNDHRVAGGDWRDD